MRSDQLQSTCDTTKERCSREKSSEKHKNEDVVAEKLRKILGCLVYSGYE
jgi:hypothetical protein